MNGSLGIQFDFDHMLTHHEEHEEKAENMNNPSSCPSW